MARVQPLTRLPQLLGSGGLVAWLHPSSLDSSSSMANYELLSLCKQLKGGACPETGASGESAAWLLESFLTGWRLERPPPPFILA